MTGFEPTISCSSNRQSDLLKSLFGKAFKFQRGCLLGIYIKILVSFLP
jgi:hypothetical protein